MNLPPQTLAWTLFFFWSFLPPQNTLSTFSLSLSVLQSSVSDISERFSSYFLFNLLYHSEAYCDVTFLNLSSFSALCFPSGLVPSTLFELSSYVRGLT
ncbi:hypothetical protein QN277_022104 [Acacia crassicarpa]|uniref:Secreted protein n=1 Tax=Acacia crassicarpa TaxID=499986 RepID=A0AAE1JEE4_9FABA|nr:hypothetical protein QN277_022104 [Acacia crassicarpa]